MSWRDGSSRTVDGSRRNLAGVVESVDLLPATLLRLPTVGIALTIAAYMSVFLSITNVVGGSTRVVAAALGAIVAATVLARLVGARSAGLLTAILFAGGLLGYYYAIPQSYRELFTVTAVAADVVSMLTGLSVLRLLAADVWALAVAPVPTFLAWYLAARGRAIGAAAVAGCGLGFFVLTGDAGTAATLLGAVGVALAVGFETVSVPAGVRTHWDTIVVVVAAMLLFSVTLSVVPGGGTQPWVTDSGTPGIESSLVGTQESVQIVGSVQLSPDVRFTVESERAANWHTASYDRYTGDGWVRTGESNPYSGELDSPPGTTVRVEQTITAETDMAAFPSLWKAVSVEGSLARSAQVTDQGGLQPSTTVQEGDTYTIESEVVQASPEELRHAPTEYPDGVEERYTQLPESTPDRVGERTDKVIESAGADNPYDQAVAIESHLQESKDYSLNVKQPDGDIADEFLFEMEAGYCTYFATAMVAMLRTQGIPAKFVTGYSAGERVDDDEWVVRGQDAHAWVMVYVPDHGWVEFDPTPSAERESAREDHLEEARLADETGIDTEETSPEENDGGSDDENGTDENGTNENDTDENDTDELVGGTDVPEAAAPAEVDIENLDPDRERNDGAADPDTIQDADPTAGGNEEGRLDRPLPDRDMLGYGLLALFGLVAGATHTGATDRAYRATWLRYQRRRDPTTDVERAFARLEYLLERRYRERRPGETARDYLDALRLRDVDERVHDVGEIYERAVYGNGVSRAEADEAVDTVTRLALESTPVVRRVLYRRR